MKLREAVAPIRQRGECVGLEEIEDGRCTSAPRLLARFDEQEGLREVRAAARARASDEGFLPCRTEEGYGNCRACRRMWKARGKRGRPSAGRAALPAALPQPPWKTARLRRVAVGFPQSLGKPPAFGGSRPVSHSSHSPGDDDPFLSEKNSEKNPFGMLTHPTSVTYAPGLKCYPCSRSFMPSPLRG